MSPEKKKYSFASSFGAHELLPQEQWKSGDSSFHHLSIGIPKETTMQERRIALSPSSTAILVGRGFEIKVEKGAGLPSNFTDAEYMQAGAMICEKKEEVFDCQILLKVAPPTLAELDLLHPNQILISPIQISIISKEYVEALLKKQVIAVAMEYMMDSDGTFPMVRIMSEMAGMSAMLTAAELLSNASGGKGVLLGGISGVPPAKVVILGAGVVGEYATRTAMGLGAHVCIFDNNIYKLMRIQQRLGRQMFTSSLNPVYLERELSNADVVIGAIHSETGRAPVVVSEDMVEKIPQGSVIIDVSIDQGGCIETSEVTTHAHPTFIKYGVIHYCVPNIASRVSRTASLAMSNIITPILIQAGEVRSLEHLFYSNKGLRHGVYAYKGCLTNAYLSHHYQLKYTNLNLLLTSDA